MAGHAMKTRPPVGVAARERPSTAARTMIDAVRAGNFAPRYCLASSENFAGPSAAKILREIAGVGASTE